MYATSAGQRASDGEGKNGLFTSQLISNLATPGLDVNEVFRRTGSDVAKASNNQQVPAIYSQFFGIAYLGEVPADFQGGIIQPAIVNIGREKERDPAKLWTIGASAGTSFAEPWVIGTVHGTLGFIKNFFVEPGVDIGFVSGVSDVTLFTVCPYVHAAFYWPFTEKIGAYAGAGGGYIIGMYTFPNGKLTEQTFTADFIAGVFLFNMLDISYTFRTNFKNVTNKVSVGYSYRF